MKRGKPFLAESKPRGLCVCGKPVASNGYTSLGVRIWKRVCNSCKKRQYEFSYRIKKKPYCEKCGFRGEPCQFDVHHKDNNHDNNNEDNLLTLCANCHRLEHKNGRD